ncbi:hypothetical protein OOA_04192 [Providencia burhodogranariea DSM 19968]|uniref:DUF1543 domain-containing protein n=1 Tax=Providencia burhodogranariea DSM 19968 TaxID=1141662 RepID=K8X513_9GAMM|nr:hypothetical protein OOA_04192 [Providencia burhodogranariea DSM 19968]
MRKAWFGDKVYIDSYAVINWANEFRIKLSGEPSSNKYSLYFVNVGGYQLTTLAELYEIDLFVGRSAAEAKQKAIKALLVDSQCQHKDNLKDVDDCILLE